MPDGQCEMVGRNAVVAEDNPRRCQNTPQWQPKLGITPAAVPCSLSGPANQLRVPVPASPRRRRFMERKGLACPAIYRQSHPPRGALVGRHELFDT